MSWILVAVVVSAAPDRPVMELTAPQASMIVAADLPTGSLIFSQGDCLAVKIYSTSRYTHVGTVVEREGSHFVYDSTGGAGVRKQTLADFLTSQGDATVCVYRPEIPFSERQQANVERHLESQLGRPYAIKHHLTGKRCEGLHCAEYATDALIAADVLEAEQPPRVSPASLRKGIERSGSYGHLVTIQLLAETVQRSADASWCSRLWADTCECTRTCYSKLRGWVCCK